MPNYLCHVFIEYYGMILEACGLNINSAGLAQGLALLLALKAADFKSQIATMR